MPVRVTNLCVVMVNFLPRILSWQMETGKATYKGGEVHHDERMFAGKTPNARPKFLDCVARSGVFVGDSGECQDTRDYI
jgi:hypothetical protein